MAKNFLNYIRTYRLHFIGMCGFILSACGIETAPSIETKGTLAPTRIDFTYPNNWRAPELTHSDYKMQSGNYPCPTQEDGYRYVDPLPVIRGLAKNHRVVMLNESHNKPLHRVFALILSQDLEEIGYSHFGSELFGANQTAWLNAETGLRGTSYLSEKWLAPTYWSDPTFGQITESLSKSDLTLFSYEEGAYPPPPGAASAIDHREVTQAKNIIEYIRAKPNDKVVVYAGYHHIKEHNEGRNIVWMAEHFSKLSGINPLTVSQTDCFGAEEFDDFTLGYGLLVHEDGTPVSRNGYDLILAAPAPKTYKERPLWLRDNLDRKFIDVPSEAKFDGPTDFTLITAREKNRPETAPPEDRIYRAPLSEKVLALRSGEYILTVSDRHKTVLVSVSLKVD